MLDTIISSPIDQDDIDLTASYSLMLIAEVKRRSKQYTADHPPSGEKK
jgi:hypothetical protein